MLKCHGNNILIFSIQGNSENMLFERVNASGVGLTIGSIGNSIVNNITFRDSFMYHTWKVEDI